MYRSLWHWMRVCMFYCVYNQSFFAMSLTLIFAYHRAKKYIRQQCIECNYATFCSYIIGHTDYVHSTDEEELVGKLQDANSCQMNYILLHDVSLAFHCVVNSSRLFGFYLLQKHYTNNHEKFVNIHHVIVRRLSFVVCRPQQRKQLTIFTITLTEIGMWHLYHYQENYSNPALKKMKNVYISFEIFYQLH